MMATGPLIVAGACVVVLVGLFLMRGSAALKGELPKPLVGVVIGVVVLVAAIIMYRVTNPPRTAEGAGGEDAMAMEGGMGGGPGGGMRGPNPHRDLGQLVRKMAMLKSQKADAFTAEEGAKLLPILQTLAKAEGMTTEEAEAQKAELEGVLTQDQLAAVEAVELPRRRRGGGGGPGGPGGGGSNPPPPGGAATPAPGTGTEGGAPAPAGGGPGGGGGGGRGDWRAAMRARMLEVPYVKKLYDEKAAADATFATDEEKQSEFFRGLRGSLSPFLRGPSQEALQELIKGLSPAE